MKYALLILLFLSSCHTPRRFGGQMEDRRLWKKEWNDNQKKPNRNPYTETKNVK